MPAADTAEGFRRFSNVRVEQAAKKLRPAHISHRIVTWRQFTALRPASALPPGGTNGRQPRKSALLGQRLVPEGRKENSPGEAHSSDSASSRRDEWRIAQEKRSALLG